ncbi:hypothetical protein LUZ63_001938 [Rhynchospora breviuscula]|uniref:Reverse transcriptase n=1 Tax=Rhynchospora breviuscula TaxID=2022672 RepID=A0A9Q0CXT4_9POAL|nr:hypothetical protein LUZ63_001938 [Rhynchospora breviuscula]
MPPKKTTDTSDDTSSSSQNLQLAITTLSQEILENNRRIDQQLAAQRSESNGQINELRELFSQFLKTHADHNNARGDSGHSRARPEVPLQEHGNGIGIGRPASTPVRSNLDKNGTPILEEPGYSDQPKHRYSDTNQRINLPRSEFPIFSGENPSGWRSKCENYFDIFQIPENYKTKMAVLHFTDEAADWFDCFKEEYPNPPWQILVDEVLDRFHLENSSNPVDEFKRVHQTGRVGDYIKRFEKAKTRLMFETKIRNIPFYVMGFVSGLKEELRHAVDILDPVTLNQAYQFAKKAELNLDGLEKKYRISAKPSFYQTSDKSVSLQNNKPPKSFAYQNNGNKLNAVPTHPSNSKALSIDQKKALGLCFWCDEKYTPGHRCKGKDLHTMEGMDIIQTSEEENDCFEDASADAPFPLEDPQEEQAVITMCTPSDLQNHKTLKYKGFIGPTPICALIDSGSTHSFVNPHIVHQLSLPTIYTTPLSVKIADGSLLSTNQICQNLQFQLQGITFEGNLRVLEIQGYDVILGMDWLSQFGLMTVDWGQGTLFIKQHGKDIKLQVDTISAEVSLCQQHIDIKKETQQGSEVFVAHLFCTEPATGKELQVYDPHIKHLLDSFADVFQEPSSLPPSRPIDHQIPLLPGSKPINLRPYRFSHYQKLEIEKIIEELLHQSFIQPSTSPYSSPIILVKKKDGSWRLCVDYRQLNNQTVKNKYPIPIIDDLLDELKGAKFFSKLDLRSGYHQIRMHPSDIPKTAFRTHDGLYEYTVMPFGLTNAPATFQSLMNCVFKPFLRQFVLVFFDDILIYSPDLASHVKHLQLTLQTLRTNQLFAKLSKCVFAVTQIEYLRFIISETGVATDPKKITAMQSWPIPTTIKGLRGFLGLTGYYRKFIQNYGIISRPLTELLKKDSFNWNQQAQQAFNQLKVAMTQAPVLALPDFSQPFTIETDACNVGIGAVLLQNKRPIAFLSKKLGLKSQSLSTYEKELLAVLTAVTKWRHYISPKPFIIKTDQISLKHLLEQKIHTAMQHKGLSKLLGLDYTIEYKKGCENKIADALSRREGHCVDDVVDIAELAAVTTLLPRWVEDIQLSYIDDPWIATLQTKAREQEAFEHKLITNNQGLIRFKNRICVGHSGNWRHHLIKEVHDSSVGGHSGIFNTYKRVKAMFYWPKLKEMVQAYVLSCPTCQMTKPEHILTPGLLQPLPIPHEAWSSIGMDFITGLPISKGRNVIMVVIDRLTKYGHFIPLSHPYTAASVAQAFIDNIYKLHGTPSTIISDRDPIFTSAFWKELMTKLGITLNFSTAYHPQSDGQTERLNQCLEQYLRSMTFDQPKKWLTWLPLAELWYNTCYHSALRTSPFQALYGYAPPTLCLGDAPKSNIASVDSLLRERQHTLRQLRANLVKAQDRMKKYADCKRSERQFKVDDLVYLKLQPYRQITVAGLRNMKLSPKFYGPFKVIQRIGNLAYKLLLPPESTIHPVFHVSQLKKHIGNRHVPSPTLPVQGPLGGYRLAPEKILNRRLIPRNNQPVPQVLIKWVNASGDDSSWEDYDRIKRDFPNFILEDKKAFMERGLSHTQNSTNQEQNRYMTGSDIFLIIGQEGVSGSSAGT